MQTVNTPTDAVVCLAYNEHQSRPGMPVAQLRIPIKDTRQYTTSRLCGGCAAHDQCYEQHGMRDWPYAGSLVPCQAANSGRGARVRLSEAQRLHGNYGPCKSCFVHTACAKLHVTMNGTTGNKRRA